MDRIGELILTTPAIRAFRTGFPDAGITLAVKPSSYEAVEGNSSVDSILKLDPAKDLDSPGKLIKFIVSLRKSKYGLVAIFNPSKILNIAVFFAGIPRRIGYDRKWGFLLNKRLSDKKCLCEKHEVEYNLDLARAAGIGAQVTAPDFVITGADERRAEQIAEDNGIRPGERLVAVHAATSNPEKLWPAERFGRLCAMIEKGLKARVVLVGGPGETAISSEVIRTAGMPLCDFTGKLKLKELGALLKRSLILISCDSGPVHISAAVGTPVVALFGESREGGCSKRWGPYGPGHTVIGRPVVCDITVEDVYEAVKKKYE
jgi:ADP-heptose:LPS heptosyltransferase